MKHKQIINPAKVHAILPEMQEDKIGSDGRLLEWDKEYKESQPGHRHISHLYSFFPANQNSKYTPELMLAARKSLDYRIKHMNSLIGWSASWMISLGARFKDADLAYSSLGTLLKRNTVDNLFILGPPFQIEAGLGLTSGIAEMLLQSYLNEVELLPSLPKQWQSGSIDGLVARGGALLSLKWNDGKLQQAIITAGKVPFNKKISYQGVVKNISLKKGETVKILNLVFI